VNQEKRWGTPKYRENEGAGGQTFDVVLFLSRLAFIFMTTYFSQQEENKKDRRGYRMRVASACISLLSFVTPLPPLIQTIHHSSMYILTFFSRANLRKPRLIPNSATEDEKQILNRVILKPWNGGKSL
jgi:hypothetical protein